MGKVNSDGSVQQVCPYRFTVTPADDNNNDNGGGGDDNTLQFVYCGDRDMLDDNNGDGTVHDDVTRVVIILHGFSRDADDYYDVAVEAKDMAGASEEIVVLAPQFLREKDLEYHSLDDYHIFWRNIKWNQGHKSVLNSDDGRERPFRLSSYEIMNQMLSALDDNDRFPKLQDIVVFGHGAGSQYVQRYAAGSTVSDDVGPSVTYVVANPGTQFYLSPKRAKHGTLDEFEVPDDAQLESCPEYDDYKFGLQNMNAYMTNLGSSTLRYNYVNRNVQMMLGELDNNNWPKLDRTCSGMLQGRFRRERGVIFHNHLIDEFGSDAVAHHGFYFVPGSGHDRDRMMQSSCGLYLLYGAGTVSDACSTTMSHSLRRYLTCQGCKRNIGLVLLGAVVAAALAAAVVLYYRKQRAAVAAGQKKTSPLLELEKKEGSGEVL